MVTDLEKRARRERLQALGAQIRSGVAAAEQAHAQALAQTVRGGKAADPMGVDGAVEKLRKEE